MSKQFVYCISFIIKKPLNFLILTFKVRGSFWVNFVGFPHKQSKKNMISAENDNFVGYFERSLSSSLYWKYSHFLRCIPFNSVTTLITLYVWCYHTYLIPTNLELIAQQKKSVAWHAFQNRCWLVHSKHMYMRNSKWTPLILKTSMGMILWFESVNKYFWWEYVFFINMNLQA